MKKNLFIVVVMGILSVFLFAGCTHADKHIPDDADTTPASDSYRLDSSMDDSVILVKSSYDNFDADVVGDSNEGFTFKYSQGNEKGNIVKVKAYSLLEYEKFDDFIEDIEKDLIGENKANILAQGVVEQGDKIGYGWVYKNSGVDYIGHVVRVFPADFDAVMIFGTASGDLNDLEKVVDTFKFELQTADQD